MDFCLFRYSNIDWWWRVVLFEEAGAEVYRDQALFVIKICLDDTSYVLCSCE